MPDHASPDQSTSTWDRFSTARLTLVLLLILEVLVLPISLAFAVEVEETDPTIAMIQALLGQGDVVSGLLLSVARLTLLAIFLTMAAMGLMPRLARARQ